MTSTSQWIEGARPRTLPAAIAPVVTGSAIALHREAFVWWKALLALLVALALQVGVNYANDYSDGVKGTDAGRVGPLRLVGSGVAAPAKVKTAAFVAFAVAAGAGLALALTSAWWLVLVGALAILAAWFYTGGAAPYGYHGLGEVSVFVFFGLVAVVGTTFVQTGDVRWAEVWAGCGIGSLACALLVANNLRDIPTDEVAGKRTLAVRLGDLGTRNLFSALLTAGYVFLWLVAIASSYAALLGTLALPFAARADRQVRRGATGRDLIPVLRDTGLTELVYAVGLAAGLALARWS
jgi:1,4-dihydroxy-2-naphthoate octaprenyltransferase